MGVGAMSTRDELAKMVRQLRNLDSRGLADALIAEGWRKKPSRDEVARAIALGVDGVDGEQFDEAAVDYRLEMLQGADAVLALMDRGQRMDEYTPLIAEVRERGPFEAFPDNDAQNTFYWRGRAQLLADALEAVTAERAERDRVVAANAWDEGYGQGVRDNERDMEPADNPYRIIKENN